MSNGAGSKWYDADRGTEISESELKALSLRSALITTSNKAIDRLRERVLRFTRCVHAIEIDVQFDEAESPAPRDGDFSAGVRVFRSNSC